MLNRHNRLLVTFYVLSDAFLGTVAFLAAYLLRFHSAIATLIPITKGVPPLRQYIDLVPFVAVLVPIGFHLQGLYRLRRGRSRVDDFFAVFVGSILAVVFGIMATTYVEIYFATPEAVRNAFERRWKAGIGLKRILIAGSGELGRLVADKILEHRELGYQIIGFVDEKATGDHLGYRGMPLLGTIEEAAEISTREAIDHLYVALPPEHHVQMLELIESTSRECVDVKVVPDININDVPLQGFNSIVKRGIDMVISAIALALLAIPLGIVSALVRLTS